MTALGQIPIKDDIIIPNGTMSTTWISFFNDLFKILGVKRNQQNVDWIPELNTSIFSASGTLTGTYTQKDNLIYFNITITPDSGTTTSFLGSRWITNLPFKADGVYFGRCFDANKTDLGAFYIASGTKYGFLPAWSARYGVITISGNFITNE